MSLSSSAQRNEGGPQPDRMELALLRGETECPFGRVTGLTASLAPECVS